MAKPAAASFRISLDCRLSCLPPAQHRTDACQKLSQAERLGDVIVGAEFEADHPVDLVAPMARGDDHGNIGVRPDLAKQVETVFLAESQVQDYDAGILIDEQTSHLSAPGGRDGADIVLLQVIDDQVPHCTVVFDHEARRLAAFDGGVLLRPA